MHNQKVLLNYKIWLVATSLVLVFLGACVHSSLVDRDWVGVAGFSGFVIFWIWDMIRKITAMLDRREGSRLIKADEEGIIW